jgi:hypothetical protein
MKIDGKLIHQYISLCSLSALQFESRVLGSWNSIQSEFMVLHCA